MIAAGCEQAQCDIILRNVSTETRSGHDAATDTDEFNCLSHSTTPSPVVCPPPVPVRTVSFHSSPTNGSDTSTPTGCGASTLPRRSILKKAPASQERLLDGSRFGSIPRKGLPRKDCASGNGNIEMTLLNGVWI